MSDIHQTGQQGSDAAETGTSEATGARIPRAREGGRSAAATTRAPAPTGWVGWIVFAGAMLVVLGLFQAMWGLAALFNSGFYAVSSSGLAVAWDFTAWGWAHLIIGVVAIAVGAALLAGQRWARFAAIFLAALSAFANFLTLPAQPVWATIMIAVDVIVIYAIAVHGNEMEEMERA
ncbi:MAG TPA: hypothetical protein VI076_03695 [Actinopolymorphaceae bacterium]